jgi:hypothetical protein
MKDNLDGSERSNVLFTDYTNTRVCCNICLTCGSDPVQIIILLQQFSVIFGNIYGKLGIFKLQTEPLPRTLGCATGVPTIVPRAVVYMCFRWE